MAALATITVLDGPAVFVELLAVPGFQIGPLEAVQTPFPLSVGDRVVVENLGVDDYVILGRLA